MKGSKELWDTLASIVRSEGLELFDIEVPSGPRGVLRVFIWNPAAESAGASSAGGSSVGGEGAPAGKPGVGVADCARVSRRITDHPDIEEILPGDSLLEVSSPGVNRKLSRPEHFRGAVGERVKVTLRGTQGSGAQEEGPARSGSLVGTLTAFDESAAKLRLAVLPSGKSVPAGKAGSKAAGATTGPGACAKQAAGEAPQELEIPLSDVKKARVDFQF